jgi:hypothetical protein
VHFVILKEVFQTGLAKNMFFLNLKQNIHFFFILNSFFCLKHVLNLVKKTCFKPILNTNKTALNRLKSLLCCCTFTLDHWACALCSYITKLRNYRNLDFLLFSRVISSGIIHSRPDMQISRVETSLPTKT